MKIIRKPEVAGLFYPAQPSKLKDEINLLLEIAQSDFNAEKIFGIVAPHAGYIYSGKTAAYSYNAVKKKTIKKVIIISPSHREYFPGISVYSGDAYETPLGVVEVDNELREKFIEDSKLIFSGIEGHRKEHAVEVQIPFLQMIYNDFKIVPVVIGDQQKIFIDELSQKISEITDDETLVVASSDLSHYHSHQKADLLDSIVEERIKKLQDDELQEDFEKQKCEACGGGAIVALLKAAKNKNYNKSTVLFRNDSSDTSGNFLEVVGYLSAIIYN